MLPEIDTSFLYNLKKSLKTLRKGANNQPLNVLADLMERYLRMVGQKSMNYAEHAQVTKT